MKSVVKYIIALLLLVAMIFLTGTRELWEALSNLSLESLAYLLLIGFLLIYVSVLKWQLFLSFLSEKTSTAKLFHLYLVGYFVNLLLPSYLGGDAVRSFYVGKKSGQHQAAAATILERYTGMLAMLLLAFVFMWQVSAVNASMKLAVTLCLIGFLGATLIALNERATDFIFSFGPLNRFLPHFNKVRDALNLAARSQSLVIKTMALSFLFHTLTVFNTIAAGFVVGWYDPPLWDLFVVLPLILLIGALPVSPNGLGMQEGAFFFFLQSIGATAPQALGIALVLRAKSYLLALFGWLSWLWIRKSDGRNSSDANALEKLDYSNF